jgi:hypothetical protein
MKDFVAEVAGQTLLRLVSRGNAIIAELLRLSSHIPPVFKLNEPEHRRYEFILFDFKYLQNQDYCESKIEDSAVCLLLYCSKITRFSSLLLLIVIISSCCHIVDLIPFPNCFICFSLNFYHMKSKYCIY